MLVLTKIFPVTAPSGWLCLFDMSLSFFNTYFLVQQKIQTCLLLSQVWNETFLQGALFLFRGKYNLVSYIWLCLWLLVYYCFQFPSVDRNKKHTQVCTHIHTQSFVSICISLYILRTMSSHWNFRFSPTPQGLF